MNENILTAVFEVESEGYQAYMELTKQLITEQYVIVQGALVKKQGSQISVIQAFNNAVTGNDDAMTGSLVGGLVGVLGGPLGMLLGGATGSLIGSAKDLGDYDRNGSLLENVGEKLQEGAVALVFLAQEEREAALDATLGKFKATIIRHDAAAVQAEVEEAERLQREMALQARRELRKEKNDEAKAKIEENRAKLKANFEGFKARLKRK